MLGKFILFLLVLNPKHELNKNPGLLEEVVGYVEEAVETFALPTHPSRLAHWIYRESGWNHEAVGTIPNKRGVILHEQGYCQAHGRAKKWCMEAGYNPFERRGGIMCLGYLLHKGMEECDGDFEAAGRWYASGSCYAAKKKMNDRKEDWQKGWQRVVDGNFEGKGARASAWRKKMKLEAQRREKEIETLVRWGG